MARTKRKRTKDQREWGAIGNRLELLFETLTTNVVGTQDITVHYGEFNRLIKYCRDIESGKRRRRKNLCSATPEESAIMDLIHKHNICINWVFWGDVRTMLLIAAEHTSSVIRPELRIV
jgi:hypothetical protein